MDLPTQSDKTYVIYVQPPAFGRELNLALVDGTRVTRDAGWLGLGWSLEFQP